MSLLLKYTTPEDMLEYSEVADVEIRPKEEITLPELLWSSLDVERPVDNVDLWSWPEKGRNYD